MEWPTKLLFVLRVKVKEKIIISFLVRVRYVVEKELLLLINNDIARKKKGGDSNVLAS